MKLIEINGESWEVFDAVADEFGKLVRYVRAKNKLDDTPGYMSLLLEEEILPEVEKAYAALSDETRKAIEEE